MNEKLTLTTLCIVWDSTENKVLMINREKGSWTGYAPPGGHVDPGESMVGCAIREVMEETGLEVRELKYKGLTHFTHAERNERYLVFNYFTDQYSGELCDATVEGKPEWISLDDIGDLPLARGISERLKLVFEEGTFEHHVLWDDNGRREEQLVKL